MIFYFDTSALVKKYVWETGSQRVVDLWEQAEEITISKVGYAETLATFHRKKREGEIAAKQLKKISSSFRNDWKSFIRMDVSGELEKLVDRLVAKYPLRGFDAIHLASSLSLKKLFKSQLAFVAADRRLLDAALKERLMIQDVSE